MVAGAGLAAAARATELGARVLVLEKGDRPGGSMLLSSSVVWRYRDLATFHRECPGGDRQLQRLVFEQLDPALGWLESFGVKLVEWTGNPLTAARRFRPADLIAALARRCGELRVHAPLHELPAGAPLVLATGGFQGGPELVRRYITSEADAIMLRANRWSTRDGLRLGLGAGGATSAGMDELYGRNMPAPPARVEPSDFVRLAQVYARHAVVEAEDGTRYPPERIIWSETYVVQWTARNRGARARYVVERDRLRVRVAERTVGEMVAAARAAGARVEERDGAVVVPVAAGDHRRPRPRSSCPRPSRSRR